MVEELFPLVVFLFRRRQKYMSLVTLHYVLSMNVYELYSVAIHVG